MNKYQYGVSKLARRLHRNFPVRWSRCKRDAKKAIDNWIRLDIY